METATLTTCCFAAARAAHLGACALAVGTCGFDRLVAGPAVGDAPRAVPEGWAATADRLVLLGLLVAFASGAAWFACATIGMSDLPPAQALTGDALRLVWGGTAFGHLWRVRLLFWSIAMVAAAALPLARRQPPARAALAWGVLLAGAFLAGSLAWTGHGMLGDATRHWHLFADVAHLLLTGLWPVGLLPFLLLLRRLRRDRSLDGRRRVARVTRRFSTTSLACVIGLTVTGVGNGWFLARPVGAVASAPYGRALLVKLVLFGVAAGIGAANLFSLRPRLERDYDGDDGDDEPADGGAFDVTARRLQVNVGIELLLGVVILAVVGVLGLLAPGGAG